MPSKEKIIDDIVDLIITTYHPSESKGNIRFAVGKHFNKFLVSVIEDSSISTSSSSEDMWNELNLCAHKNTI